MKAKKVKKPCSLEQIHWRKKALLFSGDGRWRTHALPEAGIAAITMNDGPLGLRKPVEGDADAKAVQNGTYLATCFPSPATMACSWDVDAEAKEGEAIAQECLTHGTNMILAPGVNLKRNPLGGRNFEYLSEDPYLSGKMAAAFIQACQKEGVGTCLKHFVCNEQEYRRFVYTAEVDPRALHELYLKPFEIAIKEANPWAVMTAYNRLNGTYCSENPYLLKEVLRGQWHYDGVVMSDWGAVESPLNAHQNGLDLEMPCYYGKERAHVYAKAIKRGRFPSKDAEESLKRLVLLSERCHQKTETKPIDFTKQHEVAVALAERSIVLADNDGILPLSSYDDVCVIGKYAESPRFQAGGSSHVETNHAPSFLDVINEGREIPVPYEPGYSLEEDVGSEMEAALQFDAMDLATNHDKVILFLGVPKWQESEGYNRPSLRLPEAQYNLFESIYEQNHNIIVVLLSGGPVELSQIAKARAILLPYLPGEGGMEALHHILLGQVNPSGKLAETWPLRYLDVPSANFYPGNNDFSLYQESVYVGYRYYCSVSKPVQYPFGYGLSYTTYEYSNLQVGSEKFEEGKILPVTLTVTNRGTRDGEEIVELYLSPDQPKAYRPKRELKAFQKVFLKAGESKTVKFSLSFTDFAHWSIEAKDYRVESGQYTIEVGSSCEDLPLSHAVEVLGNEEGDSERFMLPSYYAPNAKRPFALAEEEFEALMGHSYLDDLPDRSDRVSVNTTLGEIKNTSFGKRQYKKLNLDALPTEKRCVWEMNLFDPIPLRCAIPNEKKLLAFVARSNHRPLTALWLRMHGKRK